MTVSAMLSAKSSTRIQPLRSSPVSFGLHAFDVQTWLVLPPTALHPHHATRNRWLHVCSACNGHPASRHVSTPTSRGRFCSYGCSSSPSSSKMVCSSTSFNKFGNIFCAPSLEHVAGLSVLCRLLGAVGTSTRADGCAFSGEPQVPRAR